MSILLELNEWLDAIGCDRAYKEDMKPTYEKTKLELQAQLRKVVELGEVNCDHVRHIAWHKKDKKKNCPKCLAEIWQSLLKEAGL